MAQSMAENLWLTYNKEVEVFMVITDFSSYFEQEAIRGVQKDTALSIICYTKPPGAFQWVENCVTESVYYQGCPFVTKMYVYCEEEDASALELKFEVCNEYLNERSVLGSAETRLSVLLGAGSTGKAFLVPMIIDPISGMLNAYDSQAGELFLRAEILKPTNQAMLIQGGVNRSKSSSRKPFYCEVSRLNEDGIQDLEIPYTLIHRSEEIAYHDNRVAYWSLKLEPLERINNGDWDRVIKIEISQNFYECDPYMFLLSNFKKVLQDGEQDTEFPLIECKTGKVSKKYTFQLYSYKIVPLTPLRYYLEHGLTVRRIYAVDMSSSNWNTTVHAAPLHEERHGKTPYEEAIGMAGNIVAAVQEAESLFLAYGNPAASEYMATVGNDDNHIPNLLHHYRQAVLTSKMESMELTGSGSDSVSVPRAPYTKGNGHGQCLAPLLKRVLEHVSNNKAEMDYYVLSIFTDGVIVDMSQTMVVLLQLAKFPISLNFIGVGSGDLGQLLSLQKDWAHPLTQEYLSRKFIQVIHFRSAQKWASGILPARGYHSNPSDLFRKEIVTPVEKQILKFLRFMQER